MSGIIEANNLRNLELFSKYLNESEKFVSKNLLEPLIDMGLSVSEAFCYVVAEKLGLDTYRADRAFFKEYFLPSVKQLEVSDYIEDDYYKNVGSVSIKSGRWEFAEECYQPYEAFVYDDFKATNKKILPSIGFFTETFDYPIVKCDNRCWMTITPNEINTMKKHIRSSCGKVAAYGLGLGYFAYCAAKKAEVSSVTVVEQSEEVIELFSKFVLPRFGLVKDKIKIVQADAFEFAKKQGDFDFVFADIWHDVSDGLEAYKKFKKLENPNGKTTYGYWIEDTLKYYL